jgi:hypothetical protein
MHPGNIAQQIYERLQPMAVARFIQASVRDRVGSEAFSPPTELPSFKHINLSLELIGEAHHVVAVECVRGF